MSFAPANLKSEIFNHQSSIIFLKRPVFVLLVAISVTTNASAQDAPTDASARLMAAIDAKGARYSDLAKQIWSFAEVGYQEVKSSALLATELETAGFKVTRGVVGIPTAFVAEFGSGKPVIGIRGEFDALPGLSQDEFSKLAEAAKANCPVSKVLNATITLDATLE